MSKEERKAYDKARYQASKDPFQKKLYQEEKDKERALKHQQAREKHNAYMRNYKKEYDQTPAGKKSKSISMWKYLGLIHDNYEQLYEDYLACFRCEICETDFKSTRDRHMDHDHDTGKFRWFLCCSCNNNDHWKKVLAEKNYKN